MNERKPTEYYSGNEIKKNYIVLARGMYKEADSA